jgi:proton-dependent oligopeptide transporter, POT family
MSVTPKGRALVALSLAAMFERIAFYGVRALLMLYMVDSQSGGLGWERGHAFEIYAHSATLAFVTPLVGGVLADALWGPRRTMVVGTAIFSVGSAALALGSGTFTYVGLALIGLASGLFRPNLNALVAGQYSRTDSWRDSALTVIQLPISLGAVLSSALLAPLGPRIGWSWAFGCAGVCSALAGIILLLTLPANADSVETRDRLSQQQQDHLRVLVLLAVGVGVFDAITIVVSPWLLRANMGATYTVRSWEIPATLVPAVSPLFTIAFAALFAWLWVRLGRRERDLRASVKMGAGMFATAIGLALMTVAPQHADAGLAIVVAAQLFEAAGDVLLYPIATATVTRLAHPRRVSTTLALWSLVTGIPTWLALKMADPFQESDPPYTLLIGGAALGGVLMILGAGALHRRMHLRVGG